jgi:L-ectoine synthase
MIVNHVAEVEGTPDEVQAPNWVSRRLLLRRDGMGFSLHETVMHAGTETHMWYRNHLEAVFCIEGEGEVQCEADGRKWAVRPGTVYALNHNDRHVLRAFSALRLVCVFNPPLSGRETHDESGAYPLLAE